MTPVCIGIPTNLSLRRHHRRVEWSDPKPPLNLRLSFPPLPLPPVLILTLTCFMLYA